MLGCPEQGGAHRPAPPPLPQHARVLDTALPRPTVHHGPTPPLSAAGQPSQLCGWRTIEHTDLCTRRPAAPSRRCQAARCSEQLCSAGWPAAWPPRPGGPPSAQLDAKTQGAGRPAGPGKRESCDLWSSQGGAPGVLAVGRGPCAGGSSRRDWMERAGQCLSGIAYIQFADRLQGMRGDSHLARSYTCLQSS